MDGYCEAKVRIIQVPAAPLPCGIAVSAGLTPGADDLGSFDVACGREINFHSLDQSIAIDTSAPGIVALRAAGFIRLSVAP